MVCTEAARLSFGSMLEHKTCQFPALQTTPPLFPPRRFAEFGKSRSKFLIFWKSRIRKADREPDNGPSLLVCILLPFFPVKGLNSSVDSSKGQREKRLDRKIQSEARDESTFSIGCCALLTALRRRHKQDCRTEAAAFLSQAARPGQ